MHDFSANHTGGVPVLGRSNQVHESKILLTNMEKLKISTPISWLCLFTPEKPNIISGPEGDKPNYVFRNTHAQGITASQPR